MESLSLCFTNVRAAAFVCSASSTPVESNSEYPRMEVSGVFISCVILAIKSFLDRCARSTSSFSSESSLNCSLTSRLRLFKISTIGCSSEYFVERVRLRAASLASFLTGLMMYSVSTYVKSRQTRKSSSNTQTIVGRTLANICHSDAPETASRTR